MMSFLIVAAVAVLVTAACSFVMLRLSRRFNLAPEVRERDVHTAPTPRLGGVAMYIGILAAFAAASLLHEFDPLFERGTEIWALLGACTLMAIVGVLDDLLDLDWMIKLAAQFAAVGLLAWNGLQIVSVPLGDTLVVASPTANFIITVFLMTLVMNAVNFVDGLDGLVAGVAIIANSLFFIYTRMLEGQNGRLDSISFASLIAIVVVGICAGFLPFNWHRAKMFMGDTGALLVGLLMATSTMSVTGQVNPSALDLKVVIASYIPILLPIAVLILPLADFVLAVVRRVLAGKSPFHADRKHLHHRLLDMGHSPVQAVLIFYLGTAVLSTALLLVFTIQSFVLPIVVLVVGATICALVLFFPVRRIRAGLAQGRLVALTRRGAPADIIPAATTAADEPNERTPE